MPLSLVETALASGLGSAAGAWVAFFFNSRLETKKRRASQIEAGYVALTIMRGKIQDIRVYEEAWQNSQTNSGPCWWQFQSPRMLPIERRQVDIASLGFLFSRVRSAAVISDVRDADHWHDDLISSIEQYRAYYEEKLNPAMHAAGLPAQMTGVEATGFERKLPRDVLLKIRDLHQRIAIRIEEMPAFIRRAALNLHLFAVLSQTSHSNRQSPPAG